MQAASSPITWTCGFRMVVWMGLLFLDRTAEGEGEGQGEEGGGHQTQALAFFSQPILPSLTLFPTTILEVSKPPVHLPEDKKPHHVNVS